MKKVSQKDLDKLKGKGWKLTDDSRKAIQEQNKASTLSKQVEAITELVKAVEGIGDAVKAGNANDGKDCTAIISKLTESIKEIKTVEEAKLKTVNREPDNRGWRFTVVRDGGGFITEIIAERK